MIVKKISEFVNVDNISQDATWNKVRDGILAFEKTLTDDKDIQIDFSGVNISEPWLFEAFVDLLKKDNIHMLFLNSEAMVNQIKITCMLESKDPNRICNKVVEKPKEKTQYEKKVEVIGNQLVDKFVICGDTATFKVANRFSQIQNNDTCDFIKFAIDKLIEINSGLKNFIIDLDGVSTQESVLREFAAMVIMYKKLGFNLGIDITDKEDEKRMGLFLHMALSNGITTGEKVKTITEFISKYPNAPGLFIKYKPSKATDTFGRQGKGEVISCRVSILRGISNANGHYSVTIDTYNAKRFFTQAHWMSEHDNGKLRGLACDTVTASIDELGFMDSFMGSKYHFIEPIQKSASQTKPVIIGFNDIGSNIKVQCTVPEMMDYVFRDWDIEFNTEFLDMAIEKSKNNK